MTTSPLQLKPLEKGELGDYGVARVKEIAFDAVMQLWRRRMAEGLTQKDLALSINRDHTAVCRNFRGPANWTFKTFGELVQGLGGDVRIYVDALEDDFPERSNYDAYTEFDERGAANFLGDFTFDTSQGLSNNNATTASVRIRIENA